MSIGKFYKIVYGYGEGDYIPIQAEELHKAFVLAMEGGKAVFEAGFLQNRGNDIFRIQEDWHTAKGWNKSHKMDDFDWADVKPLQEDYRKTLNNGRDLAEYIIKENRRDLLEKPDSEAFKELKQLESPLRKNWLQ